jgi:hypothetical protein
LPEVDAGLAAIHPKDHAEEMTPATREWLIDLVVGGIVGGITGAIVAVNIVIFSGTEDGYEASISQVFRDNPVVGIITVAFLAAGPVAGVIMARRMRRSRVAPRDE